MKAIIYFLSLQFLYVVFGMVDVKDLTVIVLISAAAMFILSYVRVYLKERKHKKQLINALLNSN